MKAWLLTNPYPQPHWHETRRMIHEMEKRGLTPIHVRPSDWIIKDDIMYIDDKPIDAPDLIINRHALAWPGPADDYSKLSEAKILEKHGTFIVNKIDQQIFALSKINAHQKYVDHDIPTPRTEIVDLLQNNIIEIIDENIGWPCVIKWPYSCLGLKVILCKSPSNLQIIIDENKILGTKVIVQEYLDLNYMIGAHGIRDGNIEAQMQVIDPDTSTENKFKANMARRNYRIPIKTTNEIRNLVQSALEALDLEWGRFDIFPTKDGLKICELNPSANMPWTEFASLNNIAGYMVDHAIMRMRSR
jgi:glutathione synthase/RimK-type ligase-like ATP-grasp enzyme